MAREFDYSQPLSDEDVAWLRERYPKNYVDRQIELAGGVSKEAPEGEDEAESGEEGAEQPEAQEEAPEGGETDEDVDDDLIGELYDPLAHTTTEVRAYLKGADEAERERVKAVEAARTDREARTSITEF